MQYIHWNYEITPTPRWFFIHIYALNLDGRIQKGMCTIPANLKQNAFLEVKMLRNYPVYITKTQMTKLCWASTQGRQTKTYM